MTFRSILLISVVFAAGCSQTPAATSPAPGAAAVVIDRLNFGRNIPSGGVVSDSAWYKFVDEVVTPRFPDGFSMSRGQGQWRNADGRIDREDGFTIELYHAAGSPPDSTFENIAKEYIRRFKQEAVAHVRYPAQQWMYWGVKPH